MAKLTQAEKDGVAFGAVGIPGPMALQSALNKVVKPDTYASIAAAQAELGNGEVKAVIAGAVPVLVAKNLAGAVYKLAFTAGS